jgi:uncharacterized membrane protein
MTDKQKVYGFLTIFGIIILTIGLLWTAVYINIKKDTDNSLWGILFFLIFTGILYIIMGVRILIYERDYIMENKKKNERIKKETIK